MGAGWDFLAQHWRAVESMALRVAQGDRTLAEDLLSEAVDRLPRIVEKTFVADLGTPLYAYAMMSLRLYMVKAAAKRARYHQRHAPLGDMHQDEEHVSPLHATALSQVQSPEHERLADCVDEAWLAMRGLSDEDRYVIYARHWLGMTFQQVADEIGISKGYSVLLYQRALERARALLMSIDPESSEEV